MKNVSQKGFTLIEVLIASTIFAMIMVMAVGIFSWASAYNSKLREMRKTGQDSREIMNMISDDIRQANGSATLKNGFNNVTIGELAILKCDSPVNCSVIESYQTTKDDSVDLGDTERNNALVIVDKKNNVVVMYSEIDSGDVVRKAVDYNPELDLINFAASIEQSIVNSSGVDVFLGFAGYAPKRNVQDRDAQPHIKIKILAQTEDYTNIEKTFRTELNLETTVTSREYNIYE